MQLASQLGQVKTSSLLKHNVKSTEPKRGRYIFNILEKRVPVFINYVHEKVVGHSIAL